MSFEKIDICDIKDSFTRLIRNDWALLTAGKAGDYNTCLLYTSDAADE